jgi:hypothetical protein
VWAEWIGPCALSIGRYITPHKTIPIHKTGIFDFTKPSVQTVGSSKLDKIDKVMWLLSPTIRAAEPTQGRDFALVLGRLEEKVAVY